MKGFRTFLEPTVGMVLTRMLAGTVPMDVKVTELTHDRIVCGPWTFDRVSGAEIDEELGWGPPPLRTGSYVVLTVELKT